MSHPNYSKKNLVRKLFNIQAGCCFYCDCQMTTKNTNAPHKATIDHIVPKSKGGPNLPYNYVLACKACNEEKADKPLVVFVMEKKRRVSNLRLNG